MMSASPEVLLAELGWTRRLAHSLTRGDGDADDVIQDTWLATLRAAPSVGRSLRPWLRRVALNLVHGGARGERRRRERERASADLGAAVATPEELVQRAEAHRQLVGLVLALEEPLRVTVLQRYFEGRTASEIARATGTPAGTVRWRLKTALAELRVGLGADLPNATESGRRRRRFALLWFPLATAVGGAIVVLIAGRGAPVAAVAAARSTTAPVAAARSTTAAVAAARSAVVHVPAPPQEPPAMDAPSLASCQQAITRAEPELVALQKKRHQWTGAQRLFREGAPNPRAWLELDRMIRRVLAGDEPVFPEYSFECRTWACRLVLLEDDRRGTAAERPRPRLDLSALAARRADPMTVFRQFEPAWNIRIQTDVNLLARIRGSERPPSVPSVDPLSRRPVLQKDIYLKLADPSGKPVEGPTAFTPPGWVATAGMPATSDACDRSLAALQSERARLRREVEGLTPPLERYRIGAVNPSLTREFAAHLQAVTGPNTLSVDCRGQICRLSGAAGVFDLERAARPLMRQGPMHTRVDRLASTNDSIWFAVAPGPRIDGHALLRERVAELQEAGHVAACGRKHPAAGSLRVRLAAPHVGGVARTRNDDGDFEGISVRLGGDLAGSSFAACVAEAIDREVVAAGLPRPLRGGVYDELWRVP